MVISMRVIGASFLIIFSLLSLFIGLLFLVASNKEISRLTVGIILIVIGLGLLILGITIIKNRISRNPKEIRMKLFKLAAKYHGKLYEDVIYANIYKSDSLEFILNELIEWKIIAKYNEKNRIVYNFPDYDLDLVIKKCHYCSNDYPLLKEIEFCPSCGGDLKITTQKVQDKNLYSLE